MGAARQGALNCTRWHWTWLCSQRNSQTPKFVGLVPFWKTRPELFRDSVPAKKSGGNCSAYSNKTGNYDGKTKEMAPVSQIYLLWSSTLHVSDGRPVHHQESKTVNSIWLHASTQSEESVWQLPVAICTVLDSWWRTERPSETCRVLLQIKISLSKWCIWLGLLQQCVTMHGPINVKDRKCPHSTARLALKSVVMAIFQNWFSW